MRIKLSHTATLLGSLVLLSATSAAAQVIPISGKVTLKQADGSVAPIAGALVDVYRTDITQKFQTTTDARGIYTVTLAYIGTYTIAVSARGARPDYRVGVRLMRQPVHDFTLIPGDGSRLTLEQIKAGATQPAGSPASNASTSESESKIKELKERKKNITRENEIVSRTFKAGNEALSSRRFDEAVALYREGLAVRPDEPALLTNLSQALRLRGADHFNAAIKLSGAAKEARMNAAKKDWLEAARSSRTAIDIVSKPSSDPEQQQIYAQNKISALATYALAMGLVAMKFDQTQAPAAWEAYKGYIAVETDPARKLKLREDALQMLFDADSMDKSIVEARKILVSEPDDLAANRVLGLALLASDNKMNFQESADHLQRYVELAPDSDPQKWTARESLHFLKEIEGITPRTKRAKTSTSPTRP